MTDMTPIKKREDFLQAYELSGGNVSVSCKKIKISRETYYRWCREDREFDKKCREVDESLLDLAETMLMKAIKDGKTAELIFFLKTKGKVRGYVERSEVDVKDNRPDFSSYSTDELIGLLDKVESNALRSN
jgi:hypothetical protein